MKTPTSLPLVSESSCGSASAQVPVYNCIVIVKTDPQTGQVSGRVANLPEISSAGSTERDVLLAISRQFKSAVQQHLAANRPIPWREPAERPVAGESERFIPVHL